MASDFISVIQPGDPNKREVGDVKAVSYTHLCPPTALT